jgi:hypothetical protein
MFTGHETQREGINAMAEVFCGQAFTAEDVPQVGAAGGAGYLRPVPVRIGRPAHRAGYFLVKARPTAAGMEFVRGFI